MKYYKNKRLKDDVVGLRNYFGGITPDTTTTLSRSLFTYSGVRYANVNLKRNLHWAYKHYFRYEIVDWRNPDEN